MALEVLYTIRDGKGQTSTMEIALPSTLTLAKAIAFAGDMALLINNIITGAITRIGIALMIDLPSGLRATPLTTSDVEEGARFQFRTNQGHYTSLRIPTFSEGKIVPGSRQVDLTDGQVAAFVTGMVNGIDIDPTAGTDIVQPSDKRNEDIVALVSAKEQFMSSRG